MVKKILLFSLFAFVLFKLITGYLPVEVIPVQYAEVEDTLEGEFLILREEIAVTTPVRGRFQAVKMEGERVAKGTVVGYLETLGGTSLEKKTTQAVKAPCAGILSYETDGLENICDPALWTQLDLSKLDPQMLETTLRDINTTGTTGTEDTNIIEAGQGIFKIVDNLAPCYFYLSGNGAYPEKVQKGDNISLRLANNKEKLFQGTVIDLIRETGSYRLLLKITHGQIPERGRQEKGELIVSSYKGIVLPEEVLLYRDNQYGVFLFKKGRACWQEVKRIAQFGGKVVLSGLERDAWIIAKPEKLHDGQWVWRIKDN